jgi:hypothetical protein
MITKILLGLTGRNVQECLAKIAEAKKRQLREAALFLEQIDAPGRRLVYRALAGSGIKKIPLVHLRRDMSRAELVSLTKRYKTRYFTIHEDHFRTINRWRGFYRRLYLEMSTDDYVAPNVKVEKIGGFCVDLAHYKKQSILDNRDFTYVYRRRGNRRLFACNHLNGYDYDNNADLHLIGSKADFRYLKTLPRFIFGRVIALEMYNSLAEQIKYKKYLEDSYEI